MFLTARMRKRSHTPLLLKLSSQNRFHLGDQAKCGVGDSFKDGEYLIRCPKCKTFYHVDCWSDECGSKCPRLSYSCWPEKIVVIELRKIWGRIRAGSFSGGIVGGLLGLLVGTIGVAVRAEHPWTIAGFISGGIYSLLLLAILGSNKKISFSTGLFLFVVGLITMAAFPKLELTISVAINLLLFIVLSVLFHREAMNALIRAIYIFLHLMLVSFGIWLTILIGSDGNPLVGSICFGITGLILGTAIGLDSMFT